MKGKQIIMNQQMSNNLVHRRTIKIPHLCQFQRSWNHAEEQESEMEEEAALEQDPGPSRPERAHRPPGMFTFNTLGQPTICGVQTAPYPVPR